MNTPNTSPLPQPREFTCESGAARTEGGRLDAPPSMMVAYGCGALFFLTIGVIQSLGISLMLDTGTFSGAQTQLGIS